ncbi:uncharacterized protein BCR38DRAFT_424153 [Pseudomassariella vexata]|uniref:Uncharacterized protein n=1 Tax=Pseudomassariella vexata TaxID=1141098 RepID=A0A1Y2EAY8_9PEZI|nr:uncharacterized protein BCR38DRAFT_424153 [Pseudomassariella vexata]ORY68729.1 hypothetical protein BCR38DRAFT_424153 [Pseudomassariella vexata]
MAKLYEVLTICCFVLVAKAPIFRKLRPYVLYCRILKYRQVLPATCPRRSISYKGKRKKRGTGKTLGKIYELCFIHPYLSSSCFVVSHFSVNFDSLERLFAPWW